MPLRITKFVESNLYTSTQEKNVTNLEQKVI